MEKNAIKKFATEARRELILRVGQRALKYGISDKEDGNPNDDTINGHLLSLTERKQRAALIEKITQKGYAQVMEEAAYTWFNRFCALRFMEVNGYLPTRVHVFTDEQNSFKPQILTEAIHLELKGLDMDKVYAYKDENKTDELYKYLLITQCNALSQILPGMFQKIADYTELLFPDNLLREGSVIQRMVELIPEDDWKDQVQIIGWLYQYYNSEKKDDVFAALKKNVKITKENIPAATQLFTPDWIVRYMVENSLGRLWLEGHPDNRAQLLPTKEEQDKYVKDRDTDDNKWHYYLEEAKQEIEVQEKLEKIRKEYAGLNPKDIRVIDPCEGSGHILSYMFDALIRIYEAHGVQTRDAVKSIIENNIYGLDIDERAAQLAYFSVMMKARQYDRRLFSRKDEDGNVTIPQPHVYAIKESNHIDSFALEYFCNGDVGLKSAMDDITRELYDAKEYGSIITVSKQDWPLLYARLYEVDKDISIYRESVLNTIKPLIEVAEVLAQKYDVVVTNPPYMGASNMNPKVNEFIKKYYADYKSDFFSAFVVHASEMTKPDGYCGFFTPYVWMFIQSYEKLRQYLYSKATIETLIQFEYSAFEEATVPVCTFAFSNSHVKGKKGNYLRLVDFRGGMEVQCQKTLEAIVDHSCGYYYEQTTDNFSKIPGSPVAYWVSSEYLRIFNNKTIGTVTFSDGQNKTGNNDLFIRSWWEVNDQDIGQEKRWVLCARGGGCKKWYGFISETIDWSSKTREHYRKDHVARIVPEYIWYLPGITWSRITSGTRSFRVQPQGMLFEMSGLTLFMKDKEQSNNYLLGFLNTCVAEQLIKIITQVMTLQIRDVQALPIVFLEKYCNIVEGTVDGNINISRTDWDSYETSWDFKRHPLVGGQCSADSDQQSAISDQWSVVSTQSLAIGDLSGENGESEATLGTLSANYLKVRYENWKSECEERFQQLKKNEEELNRIFIDIYGLKDELTPDVADKDITVHRIFDCKEDVPDSMKGSNYVRTMRDEVVSLISYAVGCMFGRYSLDVPGLAYAGGAFSDQWVVVGGQYYKREVVEKYVGEELQRTLGMAEIDADCGGNISTGETAAEVRIGNTVYDLCSSEILEAIANGTGDELVKRGWKDAKRIDWKAIHCTLITGRYCPDPDNIIPICDDEYFDDDIVGRFAEFVRAVYGSDTLEENLRFIAEALGGKGSPREIIRSYFMNDFYKDHCRTYQKRPIYWLFDSGKKNGFKCLIYMHRYQPDTVARIRTDYVHEQQSRYRTAIEDLETRISNASTSERVKLNKQLKSLNDKAVEIHEYEERIHHLADRMTAIDLDDGVKVNYAKFQGVLAKIK